MAESTEREESRFRLFLSLEQWFSDARAHVVVSAAGARRVRWLARRARRLLRLRGPLCLAAAGHLLPPDELLHHVLLPDQTVTVIPTEEEWFAEEKNDTSPLPVENIDSETMSPVYKKQKKLKCKSRKNDEITENHLFVDDNDDSVGLHVEKLNTVCTPINDEDCLDGVKKKALEALDLWYGNQSVPAVDSSMQQSELNTHLSDEDMNLVVPKRRRRRRVRRRAQPGAPGAPLGDSPTHDTLPSAVETIPTMSLSKPASPNLITETETQPAAPHPTPLQDAPPNSPPPPPSAPVANSSPKANVACDLQNTVSNTNSMLSHTPAPLSEPAVLQNESRRRLARVVQCI